MDLDLFGRVLWRFKTIVGAGIAAAFVLAFFAAFRVGSNGIEYRSQQQWVSYSRIFVTERGFPWGSVGGSTDPSRFASLAILYSNFAQSDAVQKLAFGGAPKSGTIQAAPVLASQNTSDALPLISVAGISTSRTQAITLARRETLGLVRYVDNQQRANSIPLKNRVVLQVISEASAARSLSGRSKTLPIVVFLTVLIAVCGLALVLENLRSKAELAALEPEDETPSKIARPASWVGERT